MLLAKNKQTSKCKESDKSGHGAPNTTRGCGMVADHTFEPDLGNLATPFLKN